MCVCVYVRESAYVLNENTEIVRVPFSVLISKIQISPLPEVIIVPVCSGVPLPLYPLIQMKIKGKAESRRGQRTFSLISGKTQMRDNTFGKEKKNKQTKKRIFFSFVGSQKSVHF